MIDPSRSPLRGATGGTPAAGGPVEIRVLRKGDGNTWHVLLGGREKIVQFTGTLVPGAIVRGRLSPRGKPPALILFPEIRIKPPPGGRDVLSPGSAAEIARLAAARVFLRGRFCPPGPDMMAEILRLAGKKSPSETVKRAALAARCEMKGLSLPDEDFETLHGLLEGFRGDGGGGEGDRRKNRREETRERDDLPVLSSEGGDSPLPFFNHFAEGKTAWIVIPYACEIGGREYAGSLRLCRDRESGKTEAAVLSVRPGNGEAAWYFHWRTAPGGGMRVFAGGNFADGEKSLPELARKIRKHGLVLDDILYNEEFFDGFDGMPGQLNIVDEMV